MHRKNDNILKTLLLYTWLYIRGSHSCCYLSFNNALRGIFHENDCPHQLFFNDSGILFTVFPKVVNQSSLTFKLPFFSTTNHMIENHIYLSFFSKGSWKNIYQFETLTPNFPLKQLSTYTPTLQAYSPKIHIIH